MLLVLSRLNRFVSRRWCRRGFVSQENNAGRSVDILLTSYHCYWCGLPFRNGGAGSHHFVRGRHIPSSASLSWIYLRNCLTAPQRKNISCHFNTLIPDRKLFLMKWAGDTTHCRLSGPLLIWYPAEAPVLTSFITIVLFMLRITALMSLVGALFFCRLKMYRLIPISPICIVAMQSRKS